MAIWESFKFLLNKIIEYNNMEHAGITNFWFILFFVSVNLLFFLLYYKYKDKSGFLLRDIGNSKTDNDCALWDYGKYGYSAVPLNDTWQQWINSGNGKYGLVVTVNRPDLDYYNFGDEFYFIDLKTNKEISIPTGNRARNEKVGNLFHNGMVVRLMPKT